MSLSIALFVAWAASPAPLDGDEAFRRFAKPIGGTEWSGAAEAPAGVSWRTRISKPDEPGDPLLISGIVYRPDGKTPAPGVLVYVYHTDAQGHYSRGKTGTGNAARHGLLRGWMLTNSEGLYEFRTVRPAPYPGRSAAAHIHATLTADGFPEHWIEDFLFTGDPLLSEAIKAKNRTMEGHFKFILSPHRAPDGVWTARRDLRLEPPSRANGGR